MANETTGEMTSKMTSMTKPETAETAAETTDETNDSARPNGGIAAVIARWDDHAVEPLGRRDAAPVIAR